MHSIFGAYLFLRQKMGVDAAHEVSNLFSNSVFYWNERQVGE
ncbi:MAG: hypothetical protein ABSE51_13880 [Terracidiphilus sp.]|jgi:hypothetical protein